MANTTWNPSDKSASITLTGSNLIATTSGSGSLRAVDKQITGKFYWELTATTFTASTSGIGIASSVATPLTTNLASMTGTASVSRSGVIFVDATSTGISLGTITSGTVVGIAVDCSSRLIWFRLGAAGNWNNSASANPATGSGGVATPGLGVGIPVFPAASLMLASDAVTANFGDSAFTGSVPSGFTSGFTAGITSSTNALATQAAAEHWLTTNPAAQVTQVAIEHWAVPPLPAVQVTQFAVEEWGVGSPAARLTQVAVEEWGSVEASYAVPVTPAFMLAGSRAGIGSAVLVQDNADRTVMLAGIGALQQGAQTVVTPSAGDAVRAIIMA